MIQKIVFNREAQEISAYDTAGALIASWECRSDFVPGYNDEGQERESLPVGLYTGISAEITPWDERDDAYGTFYITTGDERARDIHGGGSGLDDPFAPRQGWVPTWGCLRMQNEDGEALADMIIAANAEDQEVFLVVED